MTSVMVADRRMMSRYLMVLLLMKVVVVVEVRVPIHDASGRLGSS